MTLAGYRQHTGLLGGLIDGIRTRKIAGELRPRQRILDLGCGPSFLQEHLPQECEYIGVDRDPQVIELNRKRFPNTTFVCLDFSQHDLPFSDDSMDVVVSAAILEHLDNVEHVLKESSRIIKKGGVLIATTPSKSGIILHHLLSSFGLLSHDAAEEHKDAFTRKKLELVIPHTTFRLIRFQLFEFGFNQFFMLQKGTQ